MKKNKKKIIIIISILVVLLIILVTYLLLTKNKNNKFDTSVVNNNSEYKISDNTLSAFDLYFMKVGGKNKNIIYSPLSIKYALSMLSDATTGDTHTEIENVLGNFKAKKYQNTKNMSLANSMFIKDNFKKSVKDSYIKLLKENYNAEIIYDAFKNPSNINNWVKDKTLGLIPNLLEDISGLDFLLINALEIDMEWKNPIQPINGKEFFDKEHTYDGSDFSVSYAHEEYGMYVGPIMCDIYSKLDFNNKDVKAVEIGTTINNYDIVGELGEANIRNFVGEKYEEWVSKDYCNEGTYEDTKSFIDRYIKEIDSNYKDVATSTDYTFYVDEDIKVFQKELKDYNELSLEYIAFMPEKETLDNFIKNANTDKLKDYISKLRTIELNNFEKGVITSIRGLIPLYKFEYALDLQNDLKSLGIKNVFEPSHASLINLTSNKGASISEVMHKANIEFSNEGIKAAAATEGGGAGDTNCGFDYIYKVPIKEIDITFNKPFMFLIRDKNTKEVWFAGTVYEPTEYSEKGSC